MAELYAYRANLLRAVDGDTIDVMLDLGFYVSNAQRLRLLGYDTPERGQPGFAESTAELNRVLALGSLVVQTTKRDSFGRWLAKVWAGDAIDVTRHMTEWLSLQDFTKPANGPQSQQPASPQEG